MKPPVLPRMDPSYRRMSLLILNQSVRHCSTMTPQTWCRLKPSKHPDKHTLLWNLKPDTISVERVLVGIKSFETAAAVILILIH